MDKGGVTPAPVPVLVSVFWPSSNPDTGTGTFALVSLVPVLALVPAPSQQKEPLFCEKNLSKLCYKLFPKSAYHIKDNFYAPHCLLVLFFLIHSCKRQNLFPSYADGADT